jgi:methionine synthase II (cobalamin-independent)
MERMIAQAAWGIDGIRVLPDGSLELADTMLDPRAPLTTVGIDGEPFVGLRAFLGAVAGRTTPIKLQLTGPVTLGIALLNLGVPADRAFAVAGSAVRARSRSLVAAAQETAPMAPLVVFVDEPGLTAAMHPDFPVDPNRTIDLVSSTLATLEPHAMTGLHCCGLADWPVVLQAGAQILSLPVDCGAVEHGGALGAFIEGGGHIAWGAVPTTGPIGSNPDRLWQHLSAEWCALVQGGCDPVLLRERAMITPACGLALHGEAQAELVLRLTNQVARRLRTQTEGMRLTVGA